MVTNAAQAEDTGVESLIPLGEPSGVHLLPVALVVHELKPSVEPVPVETPILLTFPDGSLTYLGNRFVPENQVPQSDKMCPIEAEYAFLRLRQLQQLDFDNSHDRSAFYQITMGILREAAEALYVRMDIGNPGVSPAVMKSRLGLRPLYGSVPSGGLGIKIKEFFDGNPSNPSSGISGARDEPMAINGGTRKCFSYSPLIEEGLDGKIVPYKGNEAGIIDKLHADLRLEGSHRHGYVLPVYAAVVETDGGRNHVSKKKLAGSIAIHGINDHCLVNDQTLSAMAAYVTSAVNRDLNALQMNDLAIQEALNAKNDMASRGKYQADLAAAQAEITCLREQLDNSQVLATAIESGTAAVGIPYRTK